MRIKNETFKVKQSDVNNNMIGSGLSVHNLFQTESNNKIIKKKKIYMQ